MAPLDAPEGVTRPIVFFDVNIGDTPAGRIKMGACSSPPLPTFRAFLIVFILCRDCLSRANSQSCLATSRPSELHSRRIS